MSAATASMRCAKAKDARRCCSSPASPVQFDEPELIVGIVRELVEGARSADQVGQRS